MRHWIGVLLFLLVVASAQPAFSEAAQAHQAIPAMAPPSAVVVPEAADGSWVYRGANPPVGERTSMAFDSQAGRTVLFGGFRGWDFLNETWIYNASANLWTNVTTSASPHARADAGLAYDPLAGRVVLFGGDFFEWDPAGGILNLVRYNDLWVYDTQANTWSQRFPSGPPTPGVGGDMVYDLAANRFIVYGGILNETWSYDYASNSWANLTSPVAPPSQLYGPMVYDAVADRTVFFGTDADHPALRATWMYDYGSNTWTNATLGTQPSAGVGMPMAFDPALRTSVLFGNGYGNGNATWEFNAVNTTWTQLQPATSPPPGTGVMVWDSGVNALVLQLVNFSLSGPRWGTWIYPAGPTAPPPTTWTQAGTGPINRSRSSVAYDASVDRVILFGGLNGLEFRNDTWAYDPPTATWTNVTQGLAPAPRVDGAMAYSARAGRTILFGGAWWVWDPSGGILQSRWYNDTWALNGASDTWGQLHPALSPSPRNAASMAYDPADDRLVLFGGYNGAAYFNDTWAYDYGNGTWANLTGGVSPSPRLAASFAFDAGSGRMVLFGGSNSSGVLGDTWTFDYPNRTWTRQTPAASPSARLDAGLVYDPSLGAELLFGGFQTNAETWTYAASTATWSQLSPTSSPPGTSGPTLVFVTSVSHPLLVDLQTGISPLETWWFMASPAPPGAPRNLQAIAGDANVTLTWSPPADAGGFAIGNYTIDRGTVSGGETMYARVGNVLRWTDTAVTNGVTYYYEVSANNSAGEGPESNEVSATPQAVPTAPAAPRNLVASPGTEQVVLMWQVPSSDGGAAITAYDVYRGTSSGGESLRATVGNVASFTDTGLVHGVTYYYQVSAVNSAGEGPKSNEAHATLAPADTTPPSITITSPANNSDISSATLHVSGTAWDNIAIATVELSTDGVNWTLANGTTSWSGTLSLSAGPHTIYARATDTSGNNQMTQVRVDVSLSTPGSGVASPPILLLAVVVLPIALAGLAAGVVLWRRRQRAGGSPPR